MKAPAALATAFLFALLPARGAAEPAPISEATARYTLRLEEELARHRLVVDGPGIRLLAVTELRGARVTAARLGGSLPFGVVGPVALSGLFRKISNPLGQGLSSPAHEERTAVRLDGSLEGSSRRGAALQGGREARTKGPEGLLPASMGDLTEGLSGGLAILGSPGIPVQGGGWLELEGGDARWTALASWSVPPAGEAGDSWHLEEAPYAGGGLVHLAAGFLGRSKSTTLCWAGALSGGPLTRSGLFSDLLVRVSAPAGRAELLGGVCSRGYRGPDGGTGGRLVHAAVAVELASPRVSASRRPGTGAGSAAGACSLRVEAGGAAGAGPKPGAGAGPGAAFTGGAPPAGGSGVGSRLGEGERWLAAECGWRRALGAGGALCLTARARQEARWMLGAAEAGEGGAAPCAAEPEVGLSESFGGELRAESRRGCAEAELSIGSREGEERYVLELRGRRATTRRGGSLLLRVTVRRPHDLPCPPAGGFLGLLGRGEIRWETMSLFLQVGTREDVPVRGGAGAPGGVPPPAGLPSITLGWDARAPVRAGR